MRYTVTYEVYIECDNDKHAFSKAVTYELAVPYRSGPKDICDFLLDKLNI